MTVYVDDFLHPAKVGRFESRWSNIIADEHDELITFANKLGLHIGWIQRKGTWREHFSVTESMRKKAILMGAVEIGFNSEELRAIYLRKREALTHNSV